MTCKPLITPRNKNGTSSLPENTSKRVNMILETKTDEIKTNLYGNDGKRIIWRKREMSCQTDQTAFYGANG